MGWILDSYICPRHAIRIVFMGKHAELGIGYHFDPDVIADCLRTLVASKYPELTQCEVVHFTFDPDWAAWSVMVEHPTLPSCHVGEAVPLIHFGEALPQRTPTTGDAIAMMWPAAAKAAADPTPQQLASACLSYNHEYGLMSDSARIALQFDALEWLRAWRKEGFLYDTAGSSGVSGEVEGQPQRTDPGH